MQLIITLFRFLLSLLWLTSPQQPIRRMTDEVRRRKQQRLDVLQEQAATYGLDVPPHITTEIEDLERELETVNILSRGQLDPSMREILNRFDPRDLIGIFTSDLARRVRVVEDGLNELAGAIKSDAAQRHIDRSRGSFIVGLLAAMILLVLVLLIILLNKGLT